MKQLYVWPNLDTYYQRMDSLQTISRAFNTNWNTIEIKPFLDHSFSAVLQRRFLLGKVSMGNITALNYKFSSNFNEIHRKEYYEYDFDNDKAVMACDYNDMTYKQEANLGLIHNWLLIFGNNQRIGFRNLLNNIGETTTTRRTGDDGYNTVERLNTNLRYQQRLIYSGQVDGSHIINNNLTSIKWLAGYSYVFNNDPDNRRYSYVRPLGSHDTIPFNFVIDAGTSVYYGGRITQLLKENNRTFKTDLVHDIYYPYSDNPIQLKIGAYHDTKNRDFNTRLLGVVAPIGTGASRLQVGDRTRQVEELLTKENFYYNPNSPNVTGFMYRDGTSLHNSYLAYDLNTAGYAGLKIPVKDLIEVYGGTRIESFNRKITGFYDPDLLGDSADIRIDTLNIFPSLNIKVKLGQNYNLRFSYGKTVNRPEFRENSPIIYEDFDQIAIIMGNPDLKPAYILNYDARIEWYPNFGEIISFATFYKEFSNPIEMFQIPAGTGWNYMPFNTEKGVSKGLEFDMRKSLLFTEGIPVLGLFKNMTLVFNTAIIKSEINTDKAFARDSVRIMPTIQV